MFAEDGTPLCSLAELAENGGDPRLELTERRITPPIGSPRTRSACQMISCQTVPDFPNSKLTASDHPSLGR